MLQNKFERPLDLAIKPSRLFYTYLSVIFLFALISVLTANSLSIIIQLILSLSLVIYTTFILKNNLVLPISRLILKDELTLEIVTKDNERLEVELYGECIVTSFLVWLNFSACDDKSKRKKFHLLLLPDSADKDQLRQLRIRLRFLAKRDKLTNKDNYIKSEL